MWLSDRGSGDSRFCPGHLSLRCLLDTHTEMSKRPSDICILSSEKWVKLEIQIWELFADVTEGKKCSYRRERDPRQSPGVLQYLEFQQRRHNRQGRRARRRDYEWEYNLRVSCRGGREKKRMQERGGKERCWFQQCEDRWVTVKQGKQWLWQEASQRPVLVGCMRDQQRLRRQCEAEIRIAIGTFF